LQYKTLCRCCRQGGGHRQITVKLMPSPVTKLARLLCWTGDNPSFLRRPTPIVQPHAWSWRVAVEAGWWRHGSISHSSPSTAPRQPGWIRSPLHACWCRSTLISKRSTSRRLCRSWGDLAVVRTSTERSTIPACWRSRIAEKIEKNRAL
jgi:hypothetical protein